MSEIRGNETFGRLAKPVARRDRRPCLLAFDRFCESAGTDDEELVEDHK